MWVPIPLQKQCPKAKVKSVLATIASRFFIVYGLHGVLVQSASILSNLYVELTSDPQALLDSADSLALAFQQDGDLVTMVMEATDPECLCAVALKAKVCACYDNMLIRTYYVFMVILVRIILYIHTAYMHIHNIMYLRS